MRDNRAGPSPSGCGMRQRGCLPPFSRQLCSPSVHAPALAPQLGGLPPHSETFQLEARPLAALAAASSSASQAQVHVPRPTPAPAPAQTCTCPPAQTCTCPRPNLHLPAPKPAPAPPAQICTCPRPNLHLPPCPNLHLPPCPNLHPLCKSITTMHIACSSKRACPEVPRFHGSLGLTTHGGLQRPGGAAAVQPRAAATDKRRVRRGCCITTLAPEMPPKLQLKAQDDRYRPSPALRCV